MRSACAGAPGLARPLRLCRAHITRSTTTRTSSSMSTACSLRANDAAAAADMLDPAGLWHNVLQAYDRAQQTGAATKTDTSVRLLADGGVTFVLRLCTALRAKPKGPPSPSTTAGAGAGQQQQQQQQQPRNPFLPYEEELWVQHLSGSHTLLLNKFNMVPHHVLVVTRQYESQADPLNRRDLAATQQVLAAMPHGGVAFYNCGEHSGRSQPHKHVQVVPLPFEDEQLAPGAQGAPAQPPMAQVVAAAQGAAGAGPLQLFELRQLPYRAYAVALEPSSTAAELEAAAGQLLALCQAGLPAPVSYNVVLTSSFMLMVPRRRETCGPAAINSLGFAGTILLKSEEDLAFAVQHGPLNMLAEVGQPWETAAL